MLLGNKNQDYTYEIKVLEVVPVSFTQSGCTQESDSNASVQQINGHQGCFTLKNPTSLQCFNMTDQSWSVF